MTGQHDLDVFEVRTVEGYGARWSEEGTFFRGFLEPQMADGHEKGSNPYVAWPILTISCAVGWRH